MTQRSTLRLSLPSKGRLMDDSLDFLAECGLSVQKLNPRQYQAKMPALPELTVLFQRPGDIVVSVRQGSVDFGITGIDVLEENRGDNGEIIVLHDELGYGGCALMLAVPEVWDEVTDIPSLKKVCDESQPSAESGDKIPRPHRTLSQGAEHSAHAHHRRRDSRNRAHHRLCRHHLRPCFIGSDPARQSSACVARWSHPSLASRTHCESQSLANESTSARDGASLARVHRGAHAGEGKSSGHCEHARAESRSDRIQTI
ncbi:MAG: ATP phosphoribosyltransferase [Anaerolineales bacterium]|nr:ATP phosphoribosyltransferase [Anaerolineales bacterium]